MSPFTIYFAGDLFDHKDLTGNLLLADAIEKCSAGRYKVCLPQDGEAEIDGTWQDIRNADLELLLSCDLLIANLDGPDPDSGTVLEFAQAKAVDMPALLLRTDFRNSGTLPGDPWNLMYSGWQRSRSMWLNAMHLYHQFISPAKDKIAAIRQMHHDIAASIVAELDQLCKMPSCLKAGDAEAQYLRAIQFAGSELDKILTPQRIRQLVSEKIAKGIYTP